jgi:hypothetical protein
VGFGIDRRARSRKGKGLFRKAPDPKEIGERLGRLARRMEKHAVVRAGWAKDRYRVELALHPAAPLAQLVVGPDAELELVADTACVGPGYHLDVIARIEPLLDELDFAWTDAFDPASVQDAMCRWLADQLRGAGGAAGSTPRPIRIGLASERRFRVDAPVLTPLGPRDAAWRAAVLADPCRAADAFAWWQPRAPGHAARARALLAMWLDVPWREPLDADERALLERVDADLRKAHDADPALALPWPEWSELLANLGREDAEVERRRGDAEPTIGYRRHDLEVELSGGWQIVLPGAMVGAWADDGARYWATDGERAIEFSSLTAGDETDSQHLLDVAPERHPVIERFVEGARCGRAEAYEDNGVPIVIGLVTSAPHVGILTCKGGERAWALATWRSLTRA